MKVWLISVLLTCIGQIAESSTGWGPGTPISDVEIVSPDDGSYHCAERKITFESTGGTDEDECLTGVNAGAMWFDSTLHIWDTGGVGNYLSFGWMENLPNPEHPTNVGTKVTWKAPNVGANVTVTVTADDSYLDVDDYKYDDAAISNSVGIIIVKVDIDPTWIIVTEGDDSEEIKAKVSPVGLSGITYDWTWQSIVDNGGNNPSVTFSATNAATTHVVRAHWYAVTSDRCATNQVSNYRLWCTVSIGGVSVSNSVPMSVDLVDPAAEVIPSLQITGAPTIVHNAESNIWYVSGIGTMARQVSITTNWWLHANSEFTAKVLAHENQHTQDIINGFDGHEFVTVGKMFSRISPLTDPTSGGLLAKIAAEWVQYYADEQTDYNSLIDAFEVRAYNVSDTVAPDYYYSNCGNFTYP